MDIYILKELMMSEEQYCNYLSIQLLEFAGKIDPTESTIQKTEQTLHNFLISIKQLNK